MAKHINKRKQTEQMAALYEKGGITLQQIADLYGISKQTISQRFSKIEIVRPVQLPQFAQIDKSRFQYLYQTERLAINKIGIILETNPSRIHQALGYYEIPRRESINLNGKHKHLLKTLAVGQTAQIDDEAKNTYKNIHKSSKLIGIKISAKKVGEGKYLLTRVA